MSGLIWIQTVCHSKEFFEKKILEKVSRRQKSSNKGQGQKCRMFHAWLVMLTAFTFLMEGVHIWHDGC